jgi:RimJ/RimL family protein N-acetyltransferase
MSTEIPRRIEAERIYLRCYQAGDGGWYYAMSQQNRLHLQRYEAENVALSVHSEQEAEDLVRELETAWAAGKCYFLGTFEKTTDEFVAQVYIGPANLDLPEFDIGYFADALHEGQGFVTDAVKAALGFIFKYLQASRVRLECDDSNLRSQRVAERCGFVKEGHVHENRRNPDGSLSGTLYYELLKSEFDLNSYGKEG